METAPEHSAAPSFPCERLELVVSCQQSVVSDQLAATGTGLRVSEQPADDGMSQPGWRLAGDVDNRGRLCLIAQSCSRAEFASGNTLRSFRRSATRRSRRFTLFRHPMAAAVRWIGRCQVPQRSADSVRVEIHRTEWGIDTRCEDPGFGHQRETRARNVPASIDCVTRA